MKNLSFFTSIFCFLVSISLTPSAAAGMNVAGSSQAGPRVECNLPDGTRSYIPSMICKFNDGKYNYPQ